MRVLLVEKAEFVRDGLANAQIDAAGAVDVEPQGPRGRLLNRDQLDVRVEIPDALLDALPQVFLRSQRFPPSISGLSATRVRP